MRLFPPLIKEIVGAEGAVNSGAVLMAEFVLADAVFAICNSLKMEDVSVLEGIALPMLVINNPVTSIFANFFCIMFFLFSALFFYDTVFVNTVHYHKTVEYFDKSMNKCISQKYNNNIGA